MTGEADTKVELKRIKAIQIAAWISVAGNALLAAAKIASGVFYESVAVLGDGLDSLGDVVSSLLTVLAAAILIQPPDFDHPYGHQRADTIASKLLSFIIFFTGAQLTLSTVSQFLAKESGPIPDIGAIVITLVSIVGKVLLSLFPDAPGQAPLIKDAPGQRQEHEGGHHYFLGSSGGDFGFPVHRPGDHRHHHWCGGGDLDHEDRGGNLFGYQHGVDGRLTGSFGVFPGL
jgi:hypothetical protein